jgi:hypothetical protein
LKAEFYAFLIERDSMEKRRVGRTELKIDVIGLGGAPLMVTLLILIMLKELKPFQVPLRLECLILTRRLVMDLGAHNV